MPGVAFEAANGSLIDALVAAGLAKSKAEALDHQVGGEERFYGRFTILRRGKKNYGLVSWQ